MKDNYLLSGLWLVGTVGGLLYAGVNATQAAKVGALEAERAAVRAEMGRAIEAGSAGRFADAARMLEAMQAQHPHAKAVSLNLGLAYKGLELYEQADAQFQRVLAEDPQDWDAVAERATLLKIKGEEGKAFELMETVPEGQGRMAERLEGDSDWAEAGDIDRLDKLRRRHGGEERGDTAVRRLMEMDQRRKDFEAANGAKTPPAGDAPQQ